MKLTVSQKKKLAKCNTCPHARQLLGKVTCGTPVVGEKIKHNGKDVSLCGCVMELKILVTDAQCPIERWQ